MAHSAPEIIFGAASVAAFQANQQLESLLSVLHKHGVKTLDTAYVYPDSEITLGKNGASKKFVIQTKAPGLQPGTMTKRSVLQGMEKSLKDLGVRSVDLYYLHAPDKATPIEETLSAIQELYAAGKFKRFGISNYLPQDVQKIHDIQSAAHSILPTVYQGNYNAVARHIESDLFPLLRKLNISFYAYSPIAGGFLVKDSAQLRTQEVSGRFSGKTPLGDMYNVLYGKESMYAALDEWAEIAKAAGISKAALAYRWVTYHGVLEEGKGDAVIVGASKVEQLEETLGAVEEGPLDEGVVERVGGIWEMVRGEAPRDNWNDYLGLK